MTPVLGDEGLHEFTIELSDGVSTYKHTYELIATVDGEGPERTALPDPEYKVDAVTGTPQTFDMTDYFAHSTGGGLIFSYQYFEYWGNVGPA